MSINRSHTHAVLMLAAALCAVNATAQSFPSKPVRLVVPFSPGGSNDFVARAMSQPLSRALGQSVVVENRPGGSSIIGTEHVARAPADGHTLLVAGFTMLGNAALRSKLPFDPLKDFAGVIGVGSQPMVVSVHPSLPVHSVKELISFARARPGQLVYAIPAYGGAQHLSGELLRLNARIDWKFVTFQGGAPAAVAVLGGHAPILISVIPSAMPHISVGRLRALAVTSAVRSPLLSDRPTMIESGFPGFDLTGALGVLAPAGTPREAVNRLGAEMARVVQLPEIRDGLLKDGFMVQALGPAEYDAFLRAKMAQIQKIVQEAKLKID